LNVTFGKQKWFRKLVDYFNEPRNKEKKFFLIPDTPCTSIWWSIDSRDSKKHVDWNAYGASFVFCPEDYKSGDTAFTHESNPEVKLTTLLKSGYVLAGRWARSPHFNVYEGDHALENRTSFVMYCDTRIVNKQYTYKYVQNDRAVKSGDINEYYN
jgi:hypothetical protein